jgi:hypothetical protein
MIDRPNERSRESCCLTRKHGGGDLFFVDRYNFRGTKTKQRAPRAERRGYGGQVRASSEAARWLYRGTEGGSSGRRREQPGRTGRRRAAARGVRSACETVVVFTWYSWWQWDGAIRPVRKVRAPAVPAACACTRGWNGPARTAACGVERDD